MCTAQVVPVQGVFTVIFLFLIVLASVQFTSWELGTDIEIIVSDSPGIFCLLRILRLWEWKITDWYSASAWKSAFVYETNSTYRMQIDEEASRLCFVYQVHTNVSFLYPSDIQCKIWSKGISVSVSCIGIIYQYATCIDILIELTVLLSLKPFRNVLVWIFKHISVSVSVRTFSHVLECISIGKNVQTLSYRYWY